MAKTAKVKIAVIIGGNGNYSAVGWRGGGEVDTSQAAFDSTDPDEFGDCYATHYIEADIPIPEKPEPLTIEGKVTP